MNVRYLYASVRWVILASLKWWTPLVMLACVGLIVRQSVALASSTLGSTSVNVWDILLISLGGPPFGQSSLHHAIRWILPLVIYIFIFGNHLHVELTQLEDTVLIHAKSRMQWWSIRVFSCACISCLYSMTLIFTVILFSLPYVKESWREPSLICRQIWSCNNSIDGHVLYLTIFFLGSTSLFLMLTAQNTLILYIRQPILSMIIVMFMLLLSWLLGNRVPVFAQWLPGPQFILLWHSEFEPILPHFSLRWSITYNFVLSVIFSAIGFIKLKNVDLL